MPRTIKLNKQSSADPIPALCSAPTKSRMINLGKISHSSSTSPMEEELISKVRGRKFGNKSFVANARPFPKAANKQTPSQQPLKVSTNVKSEPVTVAVKLVATEETQISPPELVTPTKTSNDRKRKQSLTPLPEAKKQQATPLPITSLSQGSSPLSALSPFPLSSCIVDMNINWKSFFGDDGESLGISWEVDDSALFESQPLTENEIHFMQEVLDM